MGHDRSPGPRAGTGLPCPSSESLEADPRNVTLDLDTARILPAARHSIMARPHA